MERGAPQLYEKIRLESPAPTSDGYGGPVRGWNEEFTVRAEFIYQRAGEIVEQGRLVGQNMIVIRIRRSGQTHEIKPDWRAINTRTGEAMNIRSIIPTSDRRYLDVTAQTGVAQ